MLHRQLSKHDWKRNQVQANMHVGRSWIILLPPHMRPLYKNKHTMRKVGRAASHPRINHVVSTSAPQQALRRRSVIHQNPTDACLRLPSPRKHGSAPTTKQTRGWHRLHLKRRAGSQSPKLSPVGSARKMISQKNPRQHTREAGRKFLGMEGHRFASRARPRQLHMRTATVRADALPTTNMFAQSLNIRGITIGNEDTSALAPGALPSTLINGDQSRCSRLPKPLQRSEMPHVTRRWILQRPWNPEALKKADEPQRGPHRCIAEAQSTGVILTERFGGASHPPRLAGRANDIGPVPGDAPRGTGRRQHRRPDTATTGISLQPPQIPLIGEVVLLATIDVVELGRDTTTRGGRATHTSRSAEQIRKVGAPLRGEIIAHTSSGCRRPSSTSPSASSHRRQ